MTLDAKMQSAELAVAMAPWVDTRYRTVRRLTNREAAEKAVVAAKEFYKPLIDAVNAVIASEEWVGGRLVNVDEEAMEAVLDALGRVYSEISRETEHSVGA